MSSEQREALLETHRYINVEYGDWYDCVYSMFKSDMAQVGIHVTRMYFTGFCSQGDGACFEGEFGSLETYLDHHHQGQYPLIRKLLRHGGSVYARSTHSGRYYHENSTCISVATDTFYHLIECPTEFHEQIVDTWDMQLDQEVSAFEEAITDQWRVYMCDLYSRLEDEYDHLTSDEVVWETIEANELDKDEE